MDRESIAGTVQSGDRRGRTLGFPTANIVLDDGSGPEDGVYFGWVGRADGSTVPAAISIGRRRTFHDAASARLLEAHLLDFDGDLYGERLVVQIERPLREQIKFESVEDLVAQLTLDVQQCRSMALELQRATKQ